MTAPDKTDPQAVLDRLLKAARAAGADAADALLVDSTSAGVSYRLGKLEDLERSESADLGLRVFVGARVAFVSSTDLSPAALAELPERAVAMARLAPEDPYAGLAPAELLAKDFPFLDLEDPDEPSAELLIERARDVEAAAMAVPGVTNSEGGGASYGRNAVALATSEGFFGRYAATTRSIGVAVLAGEGTAMERDYASHAVRHASDLESPETVGRRAGERTVARLNPRKAKSASVPVVFDPRVASGLVGHFVGAISGSAIARGVSFLKDRLGEPIFGPGITIMDDPHRPRGLRSKPFDGEGVANKAMALIEKGVLTSWIMDCASARQLGLTSTGHAARGTGGPPTPSPTNLYMATGEKTPAATDGRHQGRLLRDGIDGHGRQCGYRRLQSWRGGLLDRERADRLPGLRRDYRREPQGYVPQPDTRQRSRIPPWDQCADAADRGHDPCRRLRRRPI